MVHRFGRLSSVLDHPQIFLVSSTKLRGILLFGIATSFRIYNERELTFLLFEELLSSILGIGMVL